MKIIYSTKAIVTGGRAGHAASEDGALDINLALPKELGGDGKSGTNPEQLFAAGYAACFQTALRHVANEKKLTITDSAITATVGLGPRDAGGFGLKVDMDVTLKGVSKQEAEQLISIVHGNICPYSNAVRGNVDVNIRVV
jgi:lipoyl-dependent peroxiredoxin